LRVQRPQPIVRTVRFPAVVIAAVLTLAPATSAASVPLKPLRAQTTSAARQKTVELQIAQQINLLRRARRLKPLTVSARLAAAAAQHTREMGVDGYFEHESFDGTAFWKRIERWYPSRNWSTWSVGENLAYESPDVSAQQSVTLWMNSPPHRANLLSRSWREIGISVMHFDSASGDYENAPVTLVTADFGLRR
jgi:uncharacterized protein YkwD